MSKPRMTDPQPSIEMNGITVLLDNEMYPDQDPTVVFDWASAATSYDSYEVPGTMVYEVCVSFARELGLEE